ncbi:MAG: amphi-Trp domain-containing protein [Desulfovibrio sp.]|jgi:amphi-Trp domain-containing protein|nr:amphi-Trp domain-containing protein [Desulfovibrio sp.]
MEKKKISIEQRLEYNAVVTYLENLLDAFKTGSIEVRKGERRIVLTPASDVYVAVEAKQKPEKESFSMEISWQHTRESKEGDEFCIAAVCAEQPGSDAKTGTEPAQASTPAQVNPQAPSSTQALTGTASHGHDPEKKQADETKPADMKNKKSM